MRLDHADTTPDTTEQDVNDRITFLIWSTLFFALAIFGKLPGLDLLVSARYWRPEVGFIHAQDPVVVTLYTWTPWVGRALLLAMALFAFAAPAIARALQRRGHSSAAERCAGPWRRVAALAALAAQRENLSVELWTAAESAAALAQLRLVSRQTLALLCGHPDSVETFTRRLYLAGMPRNQMFADLFLPHAR